MPMVRRCRAPSNTVTARSCASSSSRACPRNAAPPGRKRHVPRRPLDEPAAEPFLETFQLETDRALRRRHRLSREREAAKLRDANESVHGVQVEGGFYHFQL